MIARFGLNGISHEEKLGIYTEFQEVVSMGNFSTGFIFQKYFGDDLRMLVIISICGQKTPDITFAQTILADMNDESYIAEASGYMNLRRAEEFMPGSEPHRRLVEKALKNFTK